MSECEYEDCDNEAEYIENGESVCCEECMHTEIDNGRDPSEFESLDRDKVQIAPKQFMSRDSGQPFQIREYRCLTICEK